MTEDMKRSIKDAIRAAYDAGYNHGNTDGNRSCSRYVGGNVEIEMGNKLIAGLELISAATPTAVPVAIRGCFNGTWFYGPWSAQTVMTEEWEPLYAAPVAGAAPEAECKSCTILRRYEKTARERGYAMGKAAGNNELAQVQELLAFERKAHAETNTALTAEITRLEVQLAAEPAQEPAAWICIYDDGEVDYTPLRELAEAAPKAIPLYRAKGDA